MSSGERDRLMWRELLARGAREGVQLQAQLRNALVDAIVDGNLPAGRQVPSRRNLADWRASRARPASSMAKLIPKHFHLPIGGMQAALPWGSRPSSFGDRNAAARKAPELVAQIINKILPRRGIAAKPRFRGCPA